MKIYFSYFIYMFKYLKNKYCLINKIKQLELEVHNQQQVLEVLQEELTNKTIELNNLNNYTKELEDKVNNVKAIIC